MKNLILAIAFVFAPLASESLSSQINIKGVAVVHYNATWNEKNNYTEVAKVKDAKVMTAWIDKDIPSRVGRNPLSAYSNSIHERQGS